jgi:hypothetical protein
MISPFAPQGEKVDELTAGVEAPNFDLILAVELLPDPIGLLERRILIIDVRIVPAAETDRVLLDDQEGRDPSCSEYGSPRRWLAGSRRASNRACEACPGRFVLGRRSFHFLDLSLE